MTAVVESFQYSTQGATPEMVFLVFAIVGFVFFILSFAHKLRDEDGSVSPTRIVFSLIGGIICAFVAWLGLVVDVNTGLQTHALYTNAMISILFVILGGILFANFVYSIVIPEFIEPSKDDYKAPIDAGTKAEGKKA